jgi:deoxyribodipyrimidine photo-lyase
MSTAIVWFRRDLRLTDQRALREACQQHAHIIPLYIHHDVDPNWPMGGASRWWLHHSLQALQQSLRSKGSDLILAEGKPAEILHQLIKKHAIAAVYWNRDYTPAQVKHDTELKTKLAQSQVEAHSFVGDVLHEPWKIQNGQGAPFRVFTPFWRACVRELAQSPPPIPAPNVIPPLPDKVASLKVKQLALLPDLNWADGFTKACTPGEEAAQARLKQFLQESVNEYAETRNFPDRVGTSKLSAHLHFGEISPRQILAETVKKLGEKVFEKGQGAESFVREVGWREFAIHVLYHFPHTSQSPLDERFNQFEWRKDKKSLRLWQEGMTGYPIIDAGMRELWQTGWMHNRVRMIVASFLSKNLGISWLEGARWFYDTLVDADLAANSLGWQWTAGCGADAAPYYRIFNPVLQTERFDPARDYIRRYVPELAALPDAWILKPYEAPSEVLTSAGVILGKTYPKPIVELGLSRDRALALWKAARAES